MEKKTKYKYYTPTIKEFYVGFEYEIMDSDTAQWGSFIIKTQSDLVHATAFMDYEEIRVKYLDKEDIESLEFIETSNNWFTIDAPGKLGYWTQVVIDFRWIDKDNPYKDISILGKRMSENDIIFRGIIKNKSELIILLKQLNVL